MLKAYLGESYHDEIRKILKADEALLPDRIIDADINICSADMVLSGMLESCVPIVGEKRRQAVEKAAGWYLCGVLCVALESRTRVAPFLEYRKDWRRVGDRCVEKANKKMLKLMR